MCHGQENRQVILWQLIRARVPPPTKTRPSRVKNGMFKCNKPCSICPYIKSQKIVTSTSNSKKVDLHQHHTCDDNNIIYIMECLKCKLQYIGETEQTVRKRFLQHRGYVRRQETDKATGHHFSQPGHNMSDMSISVLERIRQSDPFYRKERESYYIEQFEAMRKGINRKRWLFLIGITFKNFNFVCCKFFLVVYCNLYELVCYDTALSEEAFIKKVKCITGLGPLCVNVINIL